MRVKTLVIPLVCIMLLSGCGLLTAPNTKTVEETVFITQVDNIQQESQPYFSTEKDVKKYLAGEWIFDNEYVSDIGCKMNIDENLNVHLSFNNAGLDKSEGDFTGQITFFWAYARPYGAPDLLCFELADSEYSGGDFFFLHRTIYDGKTAMSLFFAGGENPIFGMLDSEDFGNVPDEMIFEKIGGETSQLSPRKNEEFHAVYWGKGDNGESLWLDDVKWTPPSDDFAVLYPSRMTLYENDVKESVLYSIVMGGSKEILGDDLFRGEVYFVKTDEKGNIIEFMNAEYKAFHMSSVDG